jgi:uncharacterized membrane protein
MQIRKENYISWILKSCTSLALFQAYFNGFTAIDIKTGFYIAQQKIERINT